LLTVQSLRQAGWPRESLDDLFVMPSLTEPREAIKGVAWLMRSEKITHVIALDDYDVELGAALREHFRLPGIGQSTVRHFRDKLAMRVKARDLGIPVPDFPALWPHEDVRRFLASVPPPWLFKPRHEASSIGIKKLYEPEQVWRRMEELGDEVSYH